MCCLRAPSPDLGHAGRETIGDLFDSASDREPNRKTTHISIRFLLCIEYGGWRRGTVEVDFKLSGVVDGWGELSVESFTDTLRQRLGQ